jgi:hypothetical protein
MLTQRMSSMLNRELSQPEELYIQGVMYIGWLTLSNCMLANVTLRTLPWPEYVLIHAALLLWNAVTLS